mmetsp:Transcript_21532/g.46985  ORF Transcript_21532/g.46985 Transcript_21532/m.46985 type:complete len:234 (-) Transcript_21532:60-761(-)
MHRFVSFVLLHEYILLDSAPRFCSRTVPHRSAASYTSSHRDAFDISRSMIATPTRQKKIVAAETKSWSSSFPAATQTRSCTNPRLSSPLPQNHKLSRLGPSSSFSSASEWGCGGSSVLAANKRGRGKSIHSSMVDEGWGYRKCNLVANSISIGGRSVVAFVVVVVSFASLSLSLPTIYMLSSSHTRRCCPLTNEGCSMSQIVAACNLARNDTSCLGVCVCDCVTKQVATKPWC